MLKVSSISNNTISETNKTNGVNFRASVPSRSEEPDYDTFVKQQEKAQKNAKRKQNAMLGLQAGAMIAIIASVGFAFFGSKFLGKSDKALKQMMERDLSKAKDFKDLNYSKEITDFVTSWKKCVENPQALKDVGGTPIKTALLYGPPGTGKTTFVEAISKQFPDAKLFDVNVTQMGSEYQSVGERNFKKAIDIICEYADKNPKKKVIVLLDEIDSVMMVDNSLNAKSSNNMLNEFKKAFTEKLKTRDNVFTFGATNLEVNAEKAVLSGGKQLDTAMLDRFDTKLLVPLPNSKQLAKTIANHYSSVSKIPAELKSADSKQVAAIAEFLEKHGASFRKLNSIFDAAGNHAVREGDTLRYKDIINAIADSKAELNYTDAEFTKLLSDLNVKL